MPFLVPQLITCLGQNAESCIRYCLEMTLKEFICETTYYLYSDLLPCPLHAEPLRAMQARQLIDTKIMAFLNRSSDAHLQRGSVEQLYRAGTQQYFLQVPTTK